MQVMNEGMSVLNLPSVQLPASSTDDFCYLAAILPDYVSLENRKENNAREIVKFQYPTYPPQEAKHPGAI